MFKKKDFSYLKGMPGFSDKALETHQALYEGYVANTQKIQEKIETLDKTTPEYAELKRRFGWEFDGMRLHELYFENLGGDGFMEKAPKVSKLIEKSFGSLEKWKEDFLATAKMRGIGWVILSFDPETGLVWNAWISEHDGGQLAVAKTLLVLDVFEHAFFVDYGKDRPAYLETFMRNIKWEAVENRLG